MQAIRFYSPSFLRSVPGSLLLTILSFIVDSEGKRRRHGHRIHGRARTSTLYQVSLEQIATVKLRGLRRLPLRELVRTNTELISLERLEFCSNHIYARILPSFLKSAKIWRCQVIDRPASIPRVQTWMGFCKLLIRRTDINLPLTCRRDRVQVI